MHFLRKSRFRNALKETDDLRGRSVELKHSEVTDCGCTITSRITMWFGQIVNAPERAWSQFAPCLDVKTVIAKLG